MQCVKGQVLCIFVFMNDAEEIKRAFANAQRLLVITGAGVSAASGIPTFRGAGGWYRERRAEDLASMTGFQRDPKLVWEWYDYRRRLIAEARPNAAHSAIAAWQRAMEVVVVTQNVDDLHERAGTRDVIHVHGSIWRVSCMGGCGTHEQRAVPIEPLPPTCMTCRQLLRPAGVWFGEMLPQQPIAAVEAQLRRGFDLAMVVGTEAVFGYIQDWAIRAKGSGGLLVEVNTNTTVLSPLADVHVMEPAEKILPQLSAS